jgi:hypothetical protein
VGVILHRCLLTFLPGALESCSLVERALEQAGVPFERAVGPMYPRSRRRHVIALTGQRFYPVIEFEDGSAWHADARTMAETIRAGRLDAMRGAGPAAGAAGPESASR